MSPIQNTGIEIPTSEKIIVVYSTIDRRRMAARMPAGKPTSNAMNNAAMLSSMVGAKLVASSALTSPPVRIERPSCRVNVCVKNSTYCTGSGSLTNAGRSWRAWLTMAATDSYRLSVKETPLAGEAPELEAIIPARALGELQRIATAGDTVELGVHENQVVFGSSNVWLTSRRIDGQFPNYRQLLPESYEHELVAPRAELLDVVRRTSVMAQRNSPLRLRFAEGELTVSAQTQDVGESSESLPIAYSADPLEIGFNAEFLRDGLESVETDEVRVRLISPLRPAVLQSPADDFTYLIMPIRLAG